MAVDRMFVKYNITELLISFPLGCQRRAKLYGGSNDGSLSPISVYLLSTRLR